MLLKFVRCLEPVTNFTDVAFDMPVTISPFNATCGVRSTSPTYSSYPWDQFLSYCSVDTSTCFYERTFPKTYSTNYIISKTVTVGDEGCNTPPSPPLSSVVPEQIETLRPCYLNFSVLALSNNSFEDVSSTYFMWLRPSSSYGFV